MTNAALEQAITFLSRTDLIAAARQQPLPSGVTDLLKISSGDNEVLLSAQEHSRHSQEDVRHAAEFYVQQILFAPESDHYRILGVDPDDAESKLKLHYRLLVRWLHPDRNSGDWEAIFSERVNRAWHALRTPERRREYDVQLASANSQDRQILPGREIKPAQWRDTQSNTRFMSARTIKRLPIAVFSLLGVSALLALLLFSQMQPTLQPATVIADEQQALDSQEQQTPLPVTELPAPEPAVVDIPANAKAEAFVESTSKAVPEKPAMPKPAVIAAAAPLSGNTKTTAPTPTVKVSVQNSSALPKKQKIAETPAPLTAENTVAVAKADAKTSVKRGRKDRARAASIEVPRLPEVAVSASNPAQKIQVREARPDAASDVLVRQFLQRFSRVYAEGDYFALHNLFTKDLSILGAPPQRSVLRSYRQLFENSASREISIDHVTWLASDEHIVVIASYQAQVMPRGKAESQSSRGDIRLDLRVENGQLRIVKLQSDKKNG